MLELSIAKPPEQIVVAPIIMIVGSLTTVISTVFDIEHSVCPLSIVVVTERKRRVKSVVFLKKVKIFMVNTICLLVSVCFKVWGTCF